jgi:hypothetical protein
VTKTIPPDLLADIYQAAAELLEKRGWSPHGDSTWSPGGPDGDDVHSVRSAIETAADAMLPADQWNWPGEQALERFGGYLYLTRALRGGSQGHDLDYLIGSWEGQNIKPRPTQASVIQVLRECARLLEAAGHATAAAP